MVYTRWRTIWDDRDGHANLKFATQTLNYAQDSFTGGKIMRLGVPFYGRSIPEDASTAPEWRPYGDVLRDNEYELKDETNVAKSKDGVEVWFNGKDLIRKKVEMCRLFEDVCEGIFVWELGQDVSMSDIEDDEEEEGNSKKIDFRTRREKSLLAALTRAAWGDEKYDEMLAKEMQFYEEDEKKKRRRMRKRRRRRRMSFNFLYKIFIRYEYSFTWCATTASNASTTPLSRIVKSL